MESVSPACFQPSFTPARRERCSLSGSLLKVAKFALGIFIVSYGKALGSPVAAPSSVDIYRSQLRIPGYQQPLPPQLPSSQHIKHHTCCQAYVSRPGLIILENGERGYPLNNQSVAILSSHELKKKKVEDNWGRLQQAMNMTVPLPPGVPTLRWLCNQEHGKSSSMGVPYPPPPPASGKWGEHGYYCLNPRYIHNECAASAYLDGWIDDIKIISPKVFERHLLQMHALLLKGTDASPGKYRNGLRRTVPIFIGHEEEIRKIILKKASSPQQAKELIKVYEDELLVKTGRPPATSSPLMPFLLEILGGKEWAAPTPSKMIAYIARIQEILPKASFASPCTFEEAVRIAAEVHQGLIELHPVEDGNGRLARLLTRGVLWKYALRPIVFRDKVEYEFAVKLDLKQPGTQRGIFVEYLFRMIEWTSREFGPTGCIPGLPSREARVT